MPTTTDLRPINIAPESIQFTDTDLCPRCENLLTFCGKRDSEYGRVFVFECSECDASFAFVPHTIYRLHGVVS